MENNNNNFEKTIPKPMWFYKKQEKWINYEPQFSDEIEKFYWAHKTLNASPIMLVDGKCFDFYKSLEVSQGPDQKPILRGTWLFKSEYNTMIPYTPDISKKLEEEFINGTFKNVSVSTNPRRDVISHYDGTFRQYRRTRHGDPAGREVYRGWNNISCRIIPDYPVPLHLQIFGVELNILMKHPTNVGSTTPLIFHSCINFLKENGIIEGIFRISGNQLLIDDYKNRWNAGSIVHFDNLDPPDIAGLLKAFVRQIPDLLIVKGFSPDWEKLAPTQVSLSYTDIEKFKTELISLLKKLPLINQNMLKELFNLLGTISKSSRTKMSAENLATCWTPNLFPIEVISLQGGCPAFRVVMMMIEHSDIWM